MSLSAALIARVRGTTDRSDELRCTTATNLSECPPWEGNMDKDKSRQGSSRQKSSAALYRDASRLDSDFLITAIGLAALCREMATQGVQRNLLLEFSRPYERFSRRPDDEDHASAEGAIFSKRQANDPRSGRGIARRSAASSARSWNFRICACVFPDFLRRVCASASLTTGSPEPSSIAVCVSRMILLSSKATIIMASMHCCRWS